MNSELWRDIPDCKGLYQASSLGRIRRVAGRASDGRRLPQRIRRPHISENGYSRVDLWIDGVKHPHAVHSLVAAAFLGPKPAGVQVNHKNGIKADARPENLEYVSPQENIIHSVHVICVHPRGERHYKTKITLADIRCMHGLRAVGMTFESIAAQFGICRSHASRLLSKRRTWSELREAA